MRVEAKPPVGIVRYDDHLRVCHPKIAMDESA